MPLYRTAGRLRTTAALLTLLPAALVGCSSDSDADTTDRTRQVTAGDATVTVPAEPERVVVLNGALAGYLYDLDVPVAAVDPRVLGVSNRTGDFPPAWSADAEEQGTEALPTGESVNLEFVAAQQPDLIIGGGQGFTAQQSIDAYDQLTAIAPTVLVPAEMTDWQDQLRLVADIVGESDRVQPMLDAYETRLDEVAAAIDAPDGPVTYLQSRKDNKPTVIMPDAVLPELLAEVGFEADRDVLAKAGNPERPEAADWARFSPELLPTVVDAPVVVVIPLNDGRSVAELAEDPMYRQLPAFESGDAYEFPATSYRPDYRGVMDTLDLVEEQFR